MTRDSVLARPASSLLPVELWQLIFSCVSSFTDVAALACTCRLFQRLGDAPALWAALCAARGFRPGRLSAHLAPKALFRHRTERERKDRRDAAARKRARAECALASARQRERRLVAELEASQTALERWRTLHAQALAAEAQAAEGGRASAQLWLPRDVLGASNGVRTALRAPPFAAAVAAQQLRAAAVGLRVQLRQLEAAKAATLVARAAVHVVAPAA